MFNTSVIEILRTFSPEELKKFQEFVDSPYFNKHSGTANLYRRIKKYAPEFKSSRLKKEKVWSALYPDKEFSYGVFKNLIFEITHLAEKFITFDYYQRNDFQMHYDLLDSLNERQIKNLFKSKFRIVKEELDDIYRSKNVDAANYHYIMAKMYLLKWGFSQQHDRTYGSIEDFENHSVFQASAILYSLFHTSLNALNFSNNNVYNKDDNVLASFVKKAESNNLISELIESIRPKSIEIYNILNAYHKYYKSVIDNTSIEKYFEFKEALNLNARDFSKPDKFILYSGLRNALSKLNAFEMSKSKEKLDIVKLKIKDEVMLNPDGGVDQNEYTAYIQAACDLGDSDFIINFMEEFIKFLPRDARDNIKKYSMANLFFTKNEFEKSHEMIMTINLDFFIMKYYITDLQMMNYYELKEYNSFLPILDSYKHFLGKNKSVTELWKNEQMLFCNFLNKLFKLREKFDEFGFNNLKKEISSSFLSYKEWLLRKLSELTTNNV